MIDKREIFLDLPPGLSREESIAFNRRQGERDGVARIDADGTLHFTDRVKSAMADLDPGLAEPIEPRNLVDRTERLLGVVGRIK